MLKGRVKTVDFYSIQDPLSATEKQNVSPGQDSILSVKSSTPQLKTDTNQSLQIVPSVKKLTGSPSQNKVDSLFRIAEKREKQITSKLNTQTIKTDTASTINDTISLSKQINNTNFSSPLWQLPENILFSNSGQNITMPQLQENKPGFIEGNLRAESNMNWLVLTLLTSLFIFSWTKSTYEKFITQIISGSINYQISVRLFHERNILFRNVSFALHAVFYINLGLFIFYLIGNFGYIQLFPNDFLSMFSYSIAFFILYSIKLISGKIISHIFLFKEEFDEYIHNVFLFNKNIGLLLIPIIIVYPFTVEKVKTLLLYAGITLIILILLLRIYRGFQIIMRKGVNPFYLILYLCAVEILPVLFLVKFISSLI